jgi:DNA-binding GntR family transcriptional regulator
MAIKLSAADQAAQRLKAEILDGKLPGGSRLNEGPLAQRLAISRTPLREAIARLISEGLVVRDASGAASVFRPTLADLTEIYEIRMPLESLAASMAVKRATPAYASLVRERLNDLTHAQPGPEWASCHERLHMDLYENCGRPRLIALIGNLRAQSEAYVRLASLINPEFAAMAAEQHRRMVECVQSSDAEGIEAIVHAHLQLTLDRAPVILELH